MEDKNCIFCKIVNKEIPSNTVYEDNDFVAFLDIRPLSPGHTIVIPKKHYRWVWDVPNAGQYFEVVRRIALAQRKAFGVEQVLSKIVGEEVHHAHIWVFPSKEAEGDKDDLVSNTDKLKKCIE